MRFLLIDDEEYKRERISDFIANVLPSAGVVCALSVQEGLQVIKKNAIDLILLDMSLPIFSYSINEQGFQHNSYGGKDILDFLDSFEFYIPVIVITAFDRFGSEANALTLGELDEELKREYSNVYKGSVWYNSLEDSWQERLSNLINSIFNI
jgi:CheY-like chemotaxis protein